MPKGIYKRKTAKTKEPNYRYDKNRNLRLAKFGLTLEDYNRMFQEQKGCCVLCGRHQTELKLKLAVDHNHETSEVRGLLCGNCNTKLGWFEKHKQNILYYLGV